MDFALILITQKLCILEKIAININESTHKLMKLLLLLFFRNINRSTVFVKNSYVMRYKWADFTKYFLRSSKVCAIENSNFKRLFLKNPQNTVISDKFCKKFENFPFF